LIDETGLFLNPTVRRCWSKTGQTPILDGDGGHRQKVSVIGALSVSPQQQRLGFYFQTRLDGYFRAGEVVEFLRDLLRLFRGKVVVLWDGGSNHKGPLIREFLKHNRRLRLVRLPASCPDLNPVEFVWSWLKWGKLSNFAPEQADPLNEWIVEYLMALKFDPGLLRILWNRSDLPFPEPSD
jgi:transposase